MNPTHQNNNLQNEIHTSLLEKREKAFADSRFNTTRIVAPPEVPMHTKNPIEFSENTFDEIHGGIAFNTLTPLRVATLAAVLPGIINNQDSDPGGNLTSGLQISTNGSLEITEEKLLETKRRENKQSIQAILLDILVSGTYGGNDFLSKPENAPESFQYGISRYNNLIKTLILGLSSSGKTTLREQVVNASNKKFMLNTRFGNFESLPENILNIQMDRPSLYSQALDAIPDDNKKRAIIEHPPIIDLFDLNPSIEAALIDSKSLDLLAKFPRNGTANFIHILSLASLFQGTTMGAMYPFPIAGLNEDKFNANNMLSELAYLNATRKRESHAQRLNRVSHSLDVATSILPNDLKTIVAYSSIAGLPTHIVPVPATSCLEAMSYDITPNKKSEQNDLRDILILSAFSSCGILKPFMRKNKTPITITPDLTNQTIKRELVETYNPLINLANELKDPNYFGNPIALAFSDSLIGLANFLCYKSQ